MNVGRQFKQGFDQILRDMGCTVLIHKQWGTPNQQTVEARGLKNNEKNRLDKVMFQFPEAMDIQPGDILQQKGARDLWRVIDIEDEIHGDVYVNFEAKVEKFSGPASRPTPERSQVIVQGSVYGGIQLDSPHATQNFSVQVLQVDENIRHLRELLQKAHISELDKEEATHALDRILQLSRKERSPEVISKLKEKLELVKTTFDLAKDIAAAATPYLAAIAQAISQ
jgi:hypothetical protein